MEGFVFEKDAQGIVTVTIDMNGPVNLIGKSFGRIFNEVVDRLKTEEDLKGVVIASGKDTFVAGGDLNWLNSIEPGQEAELFEDVERLKAGLRRLETLGVPVVAAVNGAALGGGLELCLACHRRIALDDKKVKIGLPEVTLGLLPGGGGVVRLTRLLGIEAAFPYLVEGRQVDAQSALKAGLVDELVEKRDDLLPRAKAWILASSDNREAFTQPWDRKTYSIPGGLSNTAKFGPRIAMMSASIFKKTRGLLPAPGIILDVMVQAAGPTDFESASRYESRRFTELATKPETKNLIASFFSMNKVKGGGSRPAGYPKTSVKRLGILGAGMMGQGIAYCAAMAGIYVVLKDVDLAAAERGKAYTDKLLSGRVEHGKMTSEEKDKVLARIHASAEAESLRGCDLIIEAVFERIDVKEAVLREHQDLLAENGIWASNTSTLPISRLATAYKAPKNFIGLHFFSPVDKMPLLEIVVGREKSDETLARAFDFARQIGKTPIVVNDGTGFFTSRTILTKLEEAAQMVAEGVDPVLVENLSRSVGFPTGMLSLFDEVKLALPLDIFDTQVAMGLRDAAKDPTPEARALLRELVAEHGRRGRADGGGFFEHVPAGKEVWAGLAKWRRSSAAIPDQDVRDRILFRAVLETYKCLDEGVLRSEDDANVGSLLGIGAPTHTGGYAQFVKTYGKARFAKRCEELAAAYGERFRAPASLAAERA